MIEKVNEAFKFVPLPKEELEKRGILGELYGPCADFINPTRNGRKYSNQLWEKVFSDPIVKESFANGGIFGEAMHPADRTELDVEKIAICMPEPPKKNDKGQLMAKFHILNTPCGRILKTLCDYGYKIGISSRGTGDTFINSNGEEEVDPDTYQFQCFDAVICPSVKAARLTLVNESLEQTQIAFKKALQEAYNACKTEKDKKIMTETLKDLKLDYNTELKNDSVYNINEDQTNKAAVDDGAETMRSLKEALQANIRLEQENKELREKLSVCYAKEINNGETISNAKTYTKRLGESLQIKTDEVTHLQESLSAQKKAFQEKEQEVIRLQNQVNSNLKSYQTLQEQFNSTKRDLNSQKRLIEGLKESLSKSKTEHEEKISRLEESLNEKEQALILIKQESLNNTNKQKQLIERYKTIAKAAVDKYINEKAKTLGIKPIDIKNQLGENYSFADIDRSCEKFKQYSLNLSKLPFTESQNIRIKAKAQKDPIIPTSRTDDEVDASLMRMVNG